MIILPRQARDKHRESSSQKEAFLQALLDMPGMSMVKMVINSFVDTVLEAKLEHLVRKTPHFGAVFI
jgi:hypothetical protein